MGERVVEAALKSIVKRLVHLSAPVLTAFLSIFFDKCYLQGRHFEQSAAGFYWAFKALWTRNVLRLAVPLPWPAGLACHVSNAKNIVFHPDNLDNFQSPGTYFQNFNARIVLGHGVYIAPNVGLITANHQVGALDEHLSGEDIILGERCWIGMNSVVLPGVILGPDTVVAAGAVVTKSFPDGRVILSGVPAKVLRSIEI